MIKIKFTKFILLFTLALVSINACYPSDLECADNTEIIIKEKISSSHQHLSSEKSQTDTSDKESHHCLCSLTCHTMFFNFQSFNSLSTYVLNFSKDFGYTSLNYPEVSYSLEKPPKV